MFLLRKKTFKALNFCLIFLIAFILRTKVNLVFASAEINLDTLNFSNVIKEWLETTKIYHLFPDFYLKLTSALANVPSESHKFIPQPMKDLSSFNLAIDKYYYRPWETSGLVMCEPWGVGNGISVCLAPIFPGDPPCPLFMDCDGDGYYWFKGEDCDENCPTCYVGSKFFTETPDGRDQDCDGIIDDDIECIPKYGGVKNFGYDSNCNFTSNTNYVLVNEGEIGEIPQDKIHCQKRWGQCTDYEGGFGNCSVSKTPGYFVKSNGVACGGGIWRAKGSNALFDCGKALREKSYRGYYGCGLDCCKPPWICDENGCYCGSGCFCIDSPCPICYPCYSVPHPYDACFPGNCPINAAFDYGGGGGGGSTPTPPSPPSPPKGVPSSLFEIFSQNPFATRIASSASQYGPWALCHGFNQYLCQPMTGCERKFVENRYY